MGNQYSEQYYIDKIDELEREKEETEENFKKHRKAIKCLNSKIELLTTAMDAIIQKSKRVDELVDNLSVLKDFFESNPHIFHLEEYDEDYNTDDEDDNTDDEINSDDENEEEKIRTQPKRKCKAKPCPKRIQPKRKSKKCNQPKSIYR